MSTNLLEKLINTDTQKIGKHPVVVLPLKDWQEITSFLEEYQASRSHSYIQSINDSRRQIKQKKLYSLDLKTGVFKKVKL